MATHIFTSIAANYIPKARVLARSLKTLHPNFLFHVVLCDLIPVWLNLDEEPFDSIITIHDLDIADPEQWLFKHTIVELSTAVKGFALRKLLSRPDSDHVLYFDPDMVILQPLTGLLKEFDASSILLTPHIAEPERTIDAILDNEFSVLQHGIYNLGFVGVKASPEGHRFATWWENRLHHFCYDDIPRGLFTDQRWADLAPAYFPDCKILRDPVYNVCTWNLTHRTVTGSLQDGFLANGRPIVFYHFSGFDSGAQEAMLNKYGRSMPALYELRDWYVAECDRLGQGELSLIPWAYGFYENGERIPIGHRKVYRERTDLQQAFPNPFLTSDPNRSYLHWLAASGEESVQRWRDTAGDEVVPEYHIAVLAMAEDIPLLADTLRSIRESSVRARDVTVFVGSDDNSVVVGGADRSPVFITCGTYHELFAAVVAKCRDKDILLIRAGLRTPEKWDLRLAWTAARQGAVGTVSPLSSNALAAIDLNNDPVSAADLDSLCATSRLSGEKETAQFWPDCVYVRAEALRELPTFSAKLTPTQLLNALARARFSNILATHVCIGCERPGGADIPKDIGIVPVIQGIRSDIQARLLVEPTRPSITKRMTKATLHIMHSWGGGLERWVHDYCTTDHEHEHYILKSFGPWSAFGSELRLFDAVDITTPLETWPLTPPIKATSGADSRYAAILLAIRQKYGIGRIIISSFIGHSIESMRQHVPTIVVCHDYYPFCPALYITFGSLCKSCDKECLAACGEENPLNSLFRNVPAVFWAQLRKELSDAAQSGWVTLVAPSSSVERHYRDLAPDLAGRITVIEHGSAPFNPLPLRFEHGRRLRILILGRLATHKGAPLFERILPALSGFTEVFLVGCGDSAPTYANREHVTIVQNYELNELPDLLSRIQPDLALLLSHVPETFSYTLQELRELAIPMLAVRIGSFVDRIEDNVTGFLCEAEPEALTTRIKHLGDNRLTLVRIHNNLKSLPHRSVRDMIAEYDRLSPAPFSRQKYFGFLDEPATAGRDLQLYWRTTEQSFQESRSSRTASYGNADQVAILTIPLQTQQLQELRLDFFSRPGLLRLIHLVIWDQHGETIWEWGAGEEFLASSPMNDLVVLDLARQQGALLWVSGNDGNIVLPIAASKLAKLENGGCVAVRFSIPSATDELPGIAAQVASLQRLRQTVAGQDAEITRLSNTINGVTNSLSWRITAPARTFMERRRKQQDPAPNPSS